MKGVLKNLPTGLKAYDYAYEEAMKRIAGHDADSEELAKQVLLWITCSERPLTTSELRYALAVEVGEAKLDEENLPQIEDMVSVCAGLVTVDEESSIIRLVHYTTQEYFERTQNDWFPKAQSKITITCVTYLSFNVFESGFCQTDDEFEKRLQLNKLYDYASHNWGHHARATSTLISEVNSFLERKAQVEASIQALLAMKLYSSDSRYSQRFPKEMTGLHLAAYFGVKAIVQLLLDRGADVNAKASEGRTPLYWPSQSGHLETVRLLLENGANIAAADKDGQTPLHRSSQSGYVEVVKLMLENGADAKAVNRYGQTPLHGASESGHVEVVKLLLENGANVAAASEFGWTPLHGASGSGHVEVVKLLLENGADIAAADELERTPLYRASGSGRVEVVVKLLSGSDW
jgi:ankyrin repeat protein